jgi:hypothetical protein
MKTDSQSATEEVPGSHIDARGLLVNSNGERAPNSGESLALKLILLLSA